MRILALSEGAQHVCYRYRIAAFAPEVARRGWQLEALPLARQTWARREQLHAARGADVVILQRKLLPFWQLRLLRRRASVLVYDFDDALFCRDSFAKKSQSSLMRLGHFWATVYASDLVLAGNQFLREQTASYIEAERVRLLPTCVEPHRYPLAQHNSRPGQAQLVWIGQPSTLGCLSLAEAHWRAAAQQVPGLCLRVVCSEFPELDALPVVPRPWSGRTEGSELAAADIGVSWLPDDTWSHGKCGLKVLQYMAAGLPVVANPVGLHRELIVPGQTGFFAESPGEWAAAVSLLAGDPALRRRMGAAGRARVEAQFSVARWAGDFGDSLLEAVRLAERARPLAGVA